MLSLAAIATVGFSIPTFPTSARQMRFAPATVEVPSIGIDAEVEQVHIIDGVMEAPDDPWKVGWYPQLAFPGQGANVVMAGHKDWWDVGPAVFWDLSELEPEADILLTSAGGDVLTYAVASVDALSAATPPSEYTAGVGHELLTLITCSGSFDGASYDERLIVRAVLQD
jgi:LPXTG-site transpeptidase (sortase) family protein